MTDTNALHRASHDQLMQDSSFTNLSIWLPAMATQALKSGSILIQGKTFTDCLIEGPAIILPAGGVTFSNCDVDDDNGDVRNLLLKPMGRSVFGAVGLRDCRFVGCRFRYVGFTGNDEFLAQVQGALGKIKQG